MPSGLLKRSLGAAMFLVLLVQSTALPLGACELDLGSEASSGHEMATQHHEGGMEHHEHDSSGDTGPPGECGALATCGVAAVLQAGDAAAVVEVEPVTVGRLLRETTPTSIVGALLTPPPKV